MDNQILHALNIICLQNTTIERFSLRFSAILFLLHGYIILYISLLKYLCECDFTIDFIQRFHTARHYLHREFEGFLVPIFFKSSHAIYNMLLGFFFIQKTTKNNKKRVKNVPPVNVRSLFS